MQLLAPMVRALSHRLAGRPLRERMRLLPIGAAVALAVIFLVSVTLGVLDPRSLTKIQRDYYPALRAGQDMRETLSDLQNALQNAARSPAIASPIPSNTPWSTPAGLSAVLSM